MTDDALLHRARRRWAALAGAPVVFRDAAVEVVASPQSSLCPPGWVGIVALGGAVIATAPGGGAADTVRRALHDLPVTAATDPAALRDVLPVAGTLGPATLAYCEAAGFRPAGATAVEPVPADHADLAALLARVPAGDAGESGLAEITSPAFVLRGAAGVVAAAGYGVWPGGTAHIGVLTAPAARGRGLARAVATAAVTDALRRGLLPQWRARPEASRRVARALGFRELGAQLSVRLRSVCG
ncbi:GNAT family N-acetyltransferase [Dactylosporangium aurantiacum]|uniref:GNAT family N-acetyltransferase n=1 Tax=Dactylosporangium aurantiacum TaxID=35754 RepID=A0A9Q9I972_9ACTN|nr:GNAT family N-acetyltransferase [Dactylosporangium aurantiacum]MDG6106934.1 GNAT family N-acetyltransferase [Dactylosporangium aurantiacum]UWZ50706.1 GNAT family N-acetyltransferase [Dactylosporangium aurantiacum]